MTSPGAAPAPTPAPFRLYDTHRRAVLDFKPLEPGVVRLYACGMTVYDRPHVGHARKEVVFDAFVRYLRHRGWTVRYVRNYTDVDDKIIARALEAGEEPLALAERFVQAFREDTDALGLLRPDEEPRVTTSIDAIVDMIRTLVDKGHAYAADGSVWFDVASHAAYGALSGQDPADMRASAETFGGKRAPHDFALWKAAKPGEPAWESPWGPGRPGWHIECSAMVRATLGDTIDIHGGGLDLVFPHHENEIAQSECCTGAPYARWWMHNGLLTLTRRNEAGEWVADKMGKSKGNAFNLRNALEDYPAEALRLFYLQAHYRSPLPWNEEALPEALALLARLYEAREVARELAGEGDADAGAEQLGPDAVDVLAKGRAFETRFHAALAEDFNTAEALGYAFELARAINRFANHKKARKRGGPVVAPALAGLDALHALGLLTDDAEGFQEQVKAKRLGALGVSREEVEQLLADRVAARTAKDWAEADRLRDRLDALGIVVMDRPDRPGGVDWKVRLTEG